MSQVPECIGFGEPGSGKISPESGNVTSDFAGDIDPGPGEPLLPSGVQLDMPDLADLMLSVCRMCQGAGISVNRGPGRPPRSPGV